MIGGTVTGGTVTSRDGRSGLETIGTVDVTAGATAAELTAD
jgi:hypothetical protein